MMILLLGYLNPCFVLGTFKDKRWLFYEHQLSVIQLTPTNIHLQLFHILNCLTFMVLSYVAVLCYGQGLNPTACIIQMSCSRLFQFCTSSSELGCEFLFLNWQQKECYGMLLTLSSWVCEYCWDRLVILWGISTHVYCSTKRPLCSVCTLTLVICCRYWWWC